ncbi:MAG: hypothetical protein JWP27_179 [Flaviaesturariibacter sp.]|nr:hypothetical protein [Flaviaesturariibacter sp.]
MNQTTLTPAPPQGAPGVTGATSVVDLNTVLQTVLEHRQEKLHGLQAILRCDRLPVVHGEEPAWLVMLTRLTDIVLDRPPVASKLFLYIRCEPEKGSPEESERRYAISFHTNCSSDSSLEIHHAAALQECGAVCHAAGGTFSYYFLSPSRCLFTLTIPGKIS